MLLERFDCYFNFIFINDVISLWVYFLSVFDVIWRLYLKGPKIIIVDDQRYEICIGIFLLVLDSWITIFIPCVVLIPRNCWNLGSTSLISSLGVDSNQTELQNKPPMTIIKSLKTNPRHPCLPFILAHWTPKQKLATVKPNPIIPSATNDLEQPHCTCWVP